MWVIHIVGCQNAIYVFGHSRIDFHVLFEHGGLARTTDVSPCGMGDEKQFARSRSSDLAVSSMDLLQSSRKVSTNLVIYPWGYGTQSITTALDRSDEISSDIWPGKTNTRLPIVCSSEQPVQIPCFAHFFTYHCAQRDDKARQTNPTRQNRVSCISAYLTHVLHYWFPKRDKDTSEFRLILSVQGGTNRQEKYAV